MIEKVYDPKKVEDKIYQFWLKTGFFNPDKLPGKGRKNLLLLYLLQTLQEACTWVML
jgi:valyl-tRNA synthetase